MKLKNLIVFLPLAIFLPGVSGEGNVSIELVDPESFTDFSVSGLDERRTESIFMGEWERFAELDANRLVPSGHTLHLKVTDIDMAGDIQPWRNRHNADIRYVEQIYPPRMNFHFTLKNAEGDVVAEGEERIRDMNFMFGFNTRFRTYNSFQYELSMLADWLRRDLPKKLEADTVANR